MEECRRMGMEVLGPDINESHLKFTVNKKGALRFGMAAIKGVGENVVEEILKERDKRGHFKDVFDFVERVNLQTVNKKTVEALADAGAFDGLGKLHRAQFFAPFPGEEGTFIERLLKYGNKFQADITSSQNSLFGSMSVVLEIKKPETPKCEPRSTLANLEKEKEVIGMYLSAHPLDEFRLELRNYCNLQLKAFEDLNVLRNREFTVGGMVTNVRRGLTKVKSSEYAILTLEDYSGTHEFAFFGEDYVKFKNYLEPNYHLMIKGRVQPKKFKQEELETKVNNISLLKEVLEKQVRNLTLKIPLQSLTEEIVTELYDLSHENKGPVTLRFHIYDTDNERQNINLLSRSVRINLTPELVRYFEERPEISMLLT